MSWAEQDRIDFPNGWRFVIHEIWKGQVLFQRWPPGVENQGFLENLQRMPITEFETAVDGAMAKQTGGVR